MASNVAQVSTRLILIGAAVLLSIGMGLRQSIGLFLTPMTRDLALTAADFTLTIAIQNIVWGLAQAPAGAIADRFGLRLTLVAGTVIESAGLAAMRAAAGGMPLTSSVVRSVSRWRARPPPWRWRLAPGRYRSRAAARCLVWSRRSARSVRSSCRSRPRA